MRPADFDLQRYTSHHFAFELRFLLVAAATWQACVDCPGERSRWPDHLIVMAGDSAFLHARNLLEVMTGREGWGKRLGIGDRRQASPFLNGYEDALHERVFHPDPRRGYLGAERPDDDLKDQVVVAAQDVLDVLEDFMSLDAVADARQALIDARHVALAEAEQAALRLGVRSPFS